MAARSDGALRRSASAMLSAAVLALAGGAASVEGAAPSQMPAWTGSAAAGPLRLAHLPGLDAHVGGLAASSARSIAFSTFLSHSSGGNLGQAVAVDDHGFIYVAGQNVYSEILVKDAFQRSPAGGEDAFVIKLSPDGQSVVFGTYLGGIRMDGATGIAVDGSHNVYVVGYTGSADFPTQHAHQPRLGSGVDAFVAKFSPAGDRLIYSSYLGGSFEDAAADVAVDAAGNAYVVGATNSYDFPTHEAFPESDPDRGTSLDGFVARFRPDGQLIYSTLLGGSEDDAVLDGAVQGDGAVVIVGETNSADFPLSHPLQAGLADDGSASGGDAFVAELEPDGRDLVFSTFLGGSKFERAVGVAVDGTGRSLVVGTTGSPDFPTRSALQSDLHGTTDAFLARIARDGTALDRATFLGGSGAGAESAFDVAALRDGQLAVLGGTGSDDFPVADAFQSTLSGDSDLFLSLLSEPMSNLLFSTYIGGSRQDSEFDFGPARAGAHLSIPAIAAGDDGALVLAATTASADFPLRDSLSAEYPGISAAVVAKIDTVPPEPPTAEACTFVNNRAPAAAIADALANPDGVPGWGMLCNPSVPPSRINVLRTWLSLQNISMPYHPVGNGLVYKCRCP